MRGAKCAVQWAGAGYEDRRASPVLAGLREALPNTVHAEGVTISGADGFAGSHLL